MKKLTKRQKRILIADAIRATVYGMFFFGAFTPIGSLGALEVGRISFVQFIVQCVLGFALAVFARYAHFKIYEEEREDEFC